MSARKVTDAALRRQEARMIEMIQCRRSIRQIYAMNFGFDLAATLRRIRQPVLVVECRVPSEDHLGAQGPRLMKLLKRGELVTLKDAGFDATDARAPDIARAAANFLLAHRHFRGIAP